VLDKSGGSRRSERFRVCVAKKSKRKIVIWHLVSAAQGKRITRLAALSVKLVVKRDRADRGGAWAAETVFIEGVAPDDEDGAAAGA
jgi:hypothetical protein